MNGGNIAKPPGYYDALPTNVEWMPAKSIYFANPDHHDLELGALIEQRQQQNPRRNLPTV